MNTICFEEEEEEKNRDGEIILNEFDEEMYTKNCVIVIHF